MNKAVGRERVPPAAAMAMALVALVILVLQIALTRLMSVMVSHHSAFLVLALVMLGLAASAVTAFLDLQRPGNAGTA